MARREKTRGIKSNPIHGIGEGGYADAKARSPKYILHRVSSSLLGPAVPSFRALSGRLKFTVRRHKFNKDYLSAR